MNNDIRVGFVGLGRLGLPVASNLARQFPLIAYDVHPQPLAEIGAFGASAASSPAEVAAKADFIGVCVRDDRQVLDVAEGPGGLLEGLRPGSVVILHSTIHPDTVRQVELRCRERGAHFIDVEVSGYPWKARTADLVLLIGGDREVVARCDGYLGAIGKQRFHLGPVGMGSVAKLSNNVMAIIASLGTYEGLNVARTNGLDLDTMIQVASVCSGDSDALHQWQVQGWQHGSIPDPFEILLSNSIYVLRVARRVAQARGSDLPVVAAVLDLFDRMHPPKTGLEHS